MRHSVGERRISRGSDPFQMMSWRMVEDGISGYAAGGGFMDGLRVRGEVGTKEAAALLWGGCKCLTSLRDDWRRGVFFLDNESFMCNIDCNWGVKYY